MNTFENRNQLTITGFRRVKKSYEKCPDPLEVWHWCTDAKLEDGVPNSVQKALFQLDVLADGWPAIDSLQFRVGLNHPQLTQELLGLDFDDRQRQLRAAVARAYKATWRYAEHFCDWRDTYKQSGTVLLPLEKFLNNWGDDICYFAEMRERTTFGLELHETMEHCVSDLRCFLEQSKRWAESSSNMVAHFPRNAPRLFLYTRLCEIYACCSGQLPTGHASGKARKLGSSPDRKLRDFLEPALIVMGYPSPASGMDRVLRDVAEYVSEDGYEFQCLIGKNNKLIDYPDFPSISLLNGLDCFSKTEL